MKKILITLSVLALLLPIYTFAGSTLSLFQGGTGWATSTSGDILVGTSSITQYGRLPIGSTGFILIASSTAPYGLAWQATSTLGITGNLGTVTSVGLSTPTGLTVSGSPITTSGTLALALQGGYVIPLTASTTQWANLVNASTTLLYVNNSTDSTLAMSGTGPYTLGINLANTNNWTNTHKWAVSSTSTYSLAAWPTTAARSDSNYSLGFTFQVSNTITVNRLGRLYVSGNTQNHGIKLWKASGTVQLASGTILASSTSDTNNYKWVSITPVTLTPGNVYAIAVDEYYPGDTWKDTWTPSFQEYFLNVTNAYSSTPGAYPGYSNTPNQSYSTPAMDFSYTATTTITGDSVNANNMTANTSFTTAQVTGATSILTLSAPTTQLTGGLDIGTQTTANSTAIDYLTTTPSPVYGTYGANGATDVFAMWRDATGYNHIGSGYQALVFNTNPSNAQGGAEAGRFDLSGNFGVGTGATVSARINAISTTEQLRLGYDASHYFSTTVGSTGGVTLNAVGSGAKFTYSNPVTINGNVGISTTTPIATLSVVSATSSIPFYVASSSNSVLNEITGAGHVITGGLTPTLSSCGTSPSIVGNDTSGQITFGGGALLTSCTVTFAVPMEVSANNKVHVFINQDSGALGIFAAQSVTTTGFNIMTSLSGATGDTVSYNVVLSN